MASPPRKPARRGASGKPRALETVVTFLEMTANPGLRHQAPVNIPGLALMRATRPPVHFYRYLYDTVGRDYFWVDRKKISDGELKAILDDDDTHVYVAFVGGVPAGYFELDNRRPRLVEINYIGLAPEFHGRGLGRWLLGESVEVAWSLKPERVIVETCTLDGPRALALYQKAGFTPYRRQAKLLELLPGM
jgi:ribosomal protein S18 acetylase RimI-like enzyme